MLTISEQMSVTRRERVYAVTTHFENSNQYILHPFLNAILILDRVEDTLIIAGQIVEQPSQISLIALLSRTQILPEACSVQMSRHLFEMISLEYFSIACDLR